MRPSVRNKCQHMALVFIALCLTFTLLATYRQESHSSQFRKTLYHSSRPAVNDEGTSNLGSIPPTACRGYPNITDVAIIVKTGATEALQKIPAQLLTFLQCEQNHVLLFSDMEQKIGKYQIYDTIDEVTAKAKTKNVDFDLYKNQYEYKSSGKPLSMLSKFASSAWILDKYKNIHTAQKAHQMLPNKSWYFFIDADTYIFWPNFFQWLKTLDPAEKLYIGSRVDDGDPPFAHGGSGYLLSKAAMAELVGDDAKEVASRYDLAAVSGCCGDQELARSLSEKNINVTNVRPLINGDNLSSIPFGPTQWCQAIITMHHTSPEEINDLWHFEQQLNNPTKPLLIGDLFSHFFQDKLISHREEWDNFSYDVQEPPAMATLEPYSSGSSKACALACERNSRCLQYLHYGDTCALEGSFKFGTARASVDGVTYTSGWMLDRIANFVAENSPCVTPS